MSKRLPAIGVWVLCSILALPAAQADRLSTLPSKEKTLLATYSGEVVVRALHAMIVVALDEPGPGGKTDGQVDQLFYMYSNAPIVKSVSFWDTEGKIEVHEDGMRVILPQHGQVLDFSFGETPRPRRGSYPSYKVQSFLEGFQLFRHSGAALKGLLLLDVDQWHSWNLQDEVKSIIPPLLPSPEPDAGGGGCAPSCTKTCLGGSCSAVCNRGFCAQCTCTGEPAVNTSCGCYFKQQ